MPETAAKPQKRRTAAPKPKAKAKGAAKPKSASQAPKKIGRPTKHTPELVAEVCERLSAGEPLLQICRDERMPRRRTFYDWVERDDSLSAQFTRAREEGCDALAEEALVISNTPQFGQKQVMSDEGSTTTVEDMLGHRKLQIETRLKLLACWNPSKYGSRTTLAGDATNPLVIDAATEAKELLEALLSNVELTKQAKVNS